MVIDVDGHRTSAQTRQSVIENALSAGERRDHSCARHRGGTDLAEQNAIAAEINRGQAVTQIGKAVSS